MTTYWHQTPVGRLRITGDGTHITGCAFADSITEAESDSINETTDEATNETTNAARHELCIPVGVIAQCVQELNAYFDGILQDFTVPVKTAGTPFRERVWTQLMHVPYGQTISYRQLAENIGQPKAIRAVGGANHHNPVVIIIPCHRVVGADGSLTGYGGGLARKRFLLELERLQGVKHH